MQWVNTRKENLSGTIEKLLIRLCYRDCDNVTFKILHNRSYSYPSFILIGYLAHKIVLWDVEMMVANPRQDSSMEK